MKCLNASRWLALVVYCSWMLTALARAEERLTGPLPSRDAPKVSLEAEIGDDVAVVLFERQEPSGKWRYSTGFLLEKQGHLHLVTARHMARVFSPNLRMGIPSSPPIWLDISSIVQEGDAADHWRHHSDADVSILDLRDRLGEHEQVLRGIAIPFEALEPEVPQRRTEVELLGYPVMLGTWENGDVTQFIVPAKVVSRMVTPPAEWKMSPSFIVTGGAAAGMSGGPVLARRTPGEKAKCVGTYYGVLTDESGPKMSIVVPAKYLQELALQEKPKTAEPFPKIDD